MQWVKGMRRWFTELFKEAFELCFTLFKIMIPVLIVVKLLEELGAIDLLTQLAAPLMTLVGLPPELALVLATAMLTSIYGGMIIFFSLAPELTLTVAQVTVLGTMILVAHALPIELRVSQKAGVRPVYLLLLRIGGAFIIGGLLHHTYLAGGWLQQTHQLQWLPEPPDPSWAGWAIAQVENLATIVLVITLLLAVLRVLKAIGVEAMLSRVLQPVLRLMGMSKEATGVVLVGMTLGLAFGAGLLLKEVRNGKISQADLFSSLSLLALCHSLIEDTLLILLLGADLSGILWARILFAIVVVISMNWLYGRMGSQLQQRYLVLSRSA